MRQCLPAVLLLTGALGCSISVKTTRLGPTYAPLPADTEVGLFSVRVPECAFEEIALVTAYADPLALQSKEDAIKALKRRARELGGNAIAGLTEVPPRGEEPISGVRGTAIRFADGSCRH